MIIIRRIDTSKPVNAALLNWLQLQILPADDPADITVGYWWVAFEDGDAIGFCAMKHSQKWSDTIYLHRAGVLPKHRGKGLQRKLIRVRTRQALKFGMTWLVSDTYHNPASANSLIRCGFTMYVPTYQYGAKGTLYWRKKI